MRASRLEIDTDTAPMQLLQVQIPVVMSHLMRKVASLLSSARSLYAPRANADHAHVHSSAASTTPACRLQCACRSYCLVRPIPYPGFPHTTGDPASNPGSLDGGRVTNNDAVQHTPERPCSVASQTATRAIANSERHRRVSEPHTSIPVSAPRIPTPLQPAVPSPFASQLLRAAPVPHAFRTMPAHSP